MASAQTSQTIRISLRWVLLAGLIMLGLGMIGGILGTQLVGPRLPVSVESPDQIVSTIEQVTVSPNKNRAQVLDMARRSIVLIGQVKNDELSYIGLGAIVTSDGLVATTASVSGEGIVAIDDTGKAVALAPQGNDPLYGITYLKLPSSVAVPIELSRATDVTGSDLITVSRHPDNWTLATHLFHAEGYQLPPERSTFQGWQRFLKGTVPATDMLTSTPVLDEEGKLAGLLLRPEGGYVLPASDVKLSLDRLVAGKREFDPFAVAGFAVEYTFSEATSLLPPQFVARVSVVAPRSSAALAGIKVGDEIIKIGEASVAWQMPVAPQLWQGLPLQLTLRRQGVERAATLEPVPTP